MSSVLVFGASGAVGGFLLPRLAAHYIVFAASRCTRTGWLAGNLDDPDTDWPATEIVISLGPLDAFARWLGRLRQPPRRVLAFSSMSATSKRGSSDAGERALAQRLRTAEETLFAAGAAHGIACTILRPTLIYGAGSDRSLAPIAHFARRWRILPIPLGAAGLRQPVHAADLATACMAVLDNVVTYGKTYELGGGECLRFDAMLWRLRTAISGFVLPVPLPLFALRALARAWPHGPLRRPALKRLREPLLADNGPAIRDFGYAPGPFRATDVFGPRAP